MKINMKIPTDRYWRRGDKYKMKMDGRKKKLCLVIFCVFFSMLICWINIIMDTGNSIEFIYDLDYSNEICETTFCLDEVIQKEVWGKVSFEPGTDNSVQIQLGNAIWPQSMLLQIGEGEGNFVIKEINYYWKNKLVYSINENELYDLANSERNYQIQMVWDDVDKYVTYFFLEDLADTNYKRIYFNENVLGHIYEQMDKILLIQIIGLFFITFSIAFILLKNMVPLLTSFAKYVSKLYFWSEKGKNVKKTYEELYFLRGLAIIGVVVCHQINFLHVSNWINCITIYSVSMLIFCAGITKSFSINNYVKKKNMSGEKYVWMSYTCNSLKSSVVSYSFCCIIYGIYYKLWNGYSFHELIVSIVEFGLSGPFYFMRYYIVLAVLAPMLYVMIRMVGKLGGGAKRFLAV